MKQPDYQISISANVTATEALEGISLVGDWWAKNFEGSAKKQGDVFTVRFGETEVTHVSFVLSKLVPDKTVVWEVTDSYLPWLDDKTEWTGTKLIWEVTANNGTTQIHFTHVGLVPAAECYGKCIKGWDQHIKGSLLPLLQQKKGLPTNGCEAR